jgi:hypothetical protein
MKRNTIFGAAALLVAGAAIGAGSVVSQNAMADDGLAEPASALTMINIGADGTAVQCNFTGAEAEALLPTLPPGIPTDDAAKAAANGVVIGIGQIAPAQGDLPQIQVGGPAGVVTSVVTGSIDPGALPANGVITVEAKTATGGIEISGTNADGTPIAAPETREGTAEECAAMRAAAITNLANLKAQVEANGGAVISTSGGSGTATKP